MAIRSSGTFAGGTLTFDASLGDGSGLTLKGGGTVNTAASPPALALDFSGSVPLSFLTARLAAQGVALTGASNVTLSVRGPASSPQVGGSIRASGLRFVDSPLRHRRRRHHGRHRPRQWPRDDQSLDGDTLHRGTLTASGSVGIDAGAGFPADLSVRLENGRYTDGQVVTHDALRRARPEGLAHRGTVAHRNVDLGRTVITVPDRLPSSLATLDVKHKNAPSDVRAQEKALNRGESSSGSSGGLTLDVTVSAPQQIFIQGRGLDAELGGSVKLTAPSRAGRPSASSNCGAVACPSSAGGSPSRAARSASPARSCPISTLRPTPPSTTRP